MRQQENRDLSLRNVTCRDTSLSRASPAPPWCALEPPTAGRIAVTVTRIRPSASTVHVSGHDKVEPESRSFFDELLTRLIGFHVIAVRSVQRYNRKTTLRMGGLTRKPNVLCEDAGLILNAMAWNSASRNVTNLKGMPGGN